MLLALLALLLAVPDNVGSSPPQADIDDLRASIVRSALRGRGRSPDDHQALCIALAADTSSEGTDPGPELLSRLSDVQWVHPVSWCRERRQGSILSLGPVVRAARTRGEWELSTWQVSYSWDGLVASYGARYAKSDSGWTSSWMRAPAPPPPTVDRAVDHRLIEAAVRDFATAWNRGDANLPGFSPQEDGPADRRWREHTLLVLDERSIAPKRESPTLARLDGQILGLFKPEPGTTWAPEPWKQDGARSPISLSVRRTGGWWREGQWAVWHFVSPWHAPVIVH
jgi:hypothetical protein